MSFPPSMNRPPIPMPPLPPGMQPPPFASFPPLPPGTMPMSMSMIPPVTSNASSPSPSSNLHRQSYSNSGRKTDSSSSTHMRRYQMFGRKNYMQPSRVASTYRKYDRDDDDDDKRDDDDPNKPKTTVFVGNISERASDMMIRQMLNKCGAIVSWKRVQGASGKLQAFGFCEYADPEASLRAMRLLHDWQIANKKLVVKVDAKTRALLDDYLAKKKNDDDDDDDNDTKSAEDIHDHDMMKKDRIYKMQLDTVMKEYASEINKASLDDDGDGSQKKRKMKEKDKKEDEKIDDMEMDEDKKNLISREIRTFRDSHKMCR